MKIINIIQSTITTKKAAADVFIGTALCKDLILLIKYGHKKLAIYGTKYSRMEQVKFVEDSL